MAELEAFCQCSFPNSIRGNASEIAEFSQAVVDFIEFPRSIHSIPLDLRGTTFQRRVWLELMTIPLGETISYLELANRLGSPTANRAVANACGANRLAVLVPCHRVVRRDGGLGGYRWGLTRKQELLAREAAVFGS